MSGSSNWLERLFGLDAKTDAQCIAENKPNLEKLEQEAAQMKREAEAKANEASKRKST